MIRDKITVSEYASIKGISKQAVYKQLNNQLKNWLIVENGKRYININALSENELKKIEQPVQQKSEPVVQQNSTSENEFLRQQIQEKDKQIESLMSQIQEKDKQIERLQEQQGTLSELLRNSQVLLAAEKPQLIEHKEKKSGLFSRLFRKEEKEG